MRSLEIAIGALRLISGEPINAEYIASEALGKIKISEYDAPKNPAVHDWATLDHGPAPDDVDAMQARNKRLETDCRELEAAQPDHAAVRDAAREECANLAVQWGNARHDDSGGKALRNYAQALRDGVTVGNPRGHRK